MIEQIYNIDGAYELFRKYNGLGNENCIFYATYEKALTSKDVAKAAVLTGIVGALGGSIIGVQPGNNNFYPGYLINVTEYGVGLIALEHDGFTTQGAINKMKIVPNSYSFIAKNDIKTLCSSKNPICLDPSIRFVTIETNNGFRIDFRVKMTNDYLTYHEKNFAYFMNHYEVNDKKNPHNSAKKLVIGLLIAAAIITIIGVLAGSSDNNDNSKIKKVPTVDTSKIKINKYNP